MKKSNIVGYVICALLPFPVMAETELAQENREAVLRSDEAGLDIPEQLYNTPGKVTASINLGTLSGEAKERVYNPSTGQRLSRLDWQYNSAPIIKGVLEWDLMKRFSLGLSGWSTVTSNAGKMNDYDWLDSSQQQWTHHSYHANTHLNDAHEIDVNIKGWLFNRPNWRLGLMAGYQEARYSFEASGGIFNYWNGKYTGQFIDAKGISYEQRFSLPYIGVAGNYRYGQNDEFEAGGSFKYSPWVDATAIDHHYFRNLVFKDDVQRQEYFSLTGNLGYALTEHSKLFFEGVANMMLNQKGDTKIYDLSKNTVTTYKNIAGIENYSYVVTLGWKYAF